MKKALSILLLFTLAFTLLCGCGKKGEDSSNNTDTTTSSTEAKVQGVQLATYKNVQVDWESESNSMLLDSALSQLEVDVKKVTDRAIKNGDTANIDYTGYKDGVKFEGGEAQGYDLAIGSGTFIPGFEEGLLGVKPGETKNLNLTFPENYGNADLAGKAVVFEVKVNYISVKEYSNEDRLNAKKSVFKNALINHLIENSKFDELPEDSVNTYEAKYRDIYTQNAASYGYDSLDAYIAAAGETKENFHKMLKENAEIQVKTELIVNAIAKLENISLTEDEYNNAVTNYASTYSTTKETFEEANGKEFIQSILLQGKVETFLENHSECK